MTEGDITITADGVEVSASEKVSTGEYETGEVSAVLTSSVEGADLSDTIPDEVRDHLYAQMRQVQAVVKAAAEERRKEAEEEAEEDEGGEA